MGGGELAVSFRTGNFDAATMDVYTMDTASYGYIGA